LNSVLPVVIYFFNLLEDDNYSDTAER